MSVATYVGTFRQPQDTSSLELPRDPPRCCVGISAEVDKHNRRNVFSVELLIYETKIQRLQPTDTCLILQEVPHT